MIQTNYQLRIFAEQGVRLVEVWLAMLTAGLHTYGTIFVSMLLVALLMPEEPALLAWGLAVGAWRLHPLLAVLAAVLGVLTTDVGLYALGRFGGRRVLQKLGLQAWLSPQRQRTMEQGFHKSGAVWLITARLLPIPGLRTGVFVSAGLLHYPWWRFIICDAVFLGLVGGVLILGGYYCGDALGRWLQGFDTVRAWLLLLGVVVAGAVLVWKTDSWLARRLSHKTLEPHDRRALQCPTSESGGDSSQTPDSESSKSLFVTASPPEANGQVLHNGTPANNTGSLSTAKDKAIALGVNHEVNHAQLKRGVSE